VSGERLTYNLRLSTYYSLCVATKYIVFSGQAQQKSSFDGRGRVAGRRCTFMLTLPDARIDIIEYAANRGAVARDLAQEDGPSKQ
jgi:hypothetical protein